MGISSNQARMMTLTARQHDLELRAQQISAQKMIYAMESESTALQYSDALNAYSYLSSAQIAANNAKDATDGFFKVNDDGTFEKTGNSSDVAAAALFGKVKSIVAPSSNAATSEAFLNKAQADYDKATKELSSKEKILDLELTQIDTEHNAVQTEYDSMKSLVKDNTDKSFNLFG